LAKRRIPWPKVRIAPTRVIRSTSPVADYDQPHFFILLINNHNGVSTFALYVRQLVSMLILA
jgi:hypothetical protein